MFRSSRLLSVLLVLAVAVLAPLFTTTPCAAKPKEIVVVGSKIKENIQDAGLLIGPGFIDAVNEQVFDELQDAVERATANHRWVLRPHDLTGFAEATRLEPIVRGDRIAALLNRRGFEVDEEFLAALSDRVRLLLAQAIVRATENARQVTLVQDL